MAFGDAGTDPASLALVADPTDGAVREAPGTSDGAGRVPNSEAALGTGPPKWSVVAEPALKRVEPAPPKRRPLIVKMPAPTRTMSRIATAAEGIAGASLMPSIRPARPSRKRLHMGRRDCMRSQSSSSNAG